MGTADVTATYGVEIEVEGADTALDAADALETLRDKIAEDTAAVGAMQKALRGLQGGTAVNIQSFRQLRAAIAAKKVEIGQANQKLVSMKGAFDGLGPAAKRAKAATDAVAFKTLKNEVFGAERSLGGLRLSTLKAVPPWVALAAAAAVAVVAIGAAAVAVTKFGIASADARRNEAIDIQASGTRLWYGYANAVQFAADETEAGAKAISGALDRVSTSTTVGRDRVAGFAKELEAAGLRGQDLETSLKAVSTAASVGKEAGLVGLFASLRFAGQGVDNLAARVQQKLGPLVERKLLSLDAQFARLKENFGQLFKNVDVTPILKALDKILGLFSQTKVVGYALRQTIEALFPTASAKTFGDVAVQVFKQVVIYGLRTVVGLLTLELAYFRIRNAARKAFDITIVRAYFDTLKAVLGPVVWLIERMIPGLNALAALRDIGSGEGGPGFDLGKSVGEGIRDGVYGSEPGVLNAIGGMASHMIASFKDKLLIRSPSKVFEDAAGQVPAGAAKGIDGGAGDVQAAANRMAPKPGGGAGGGATITVNIAEGAIQIGAGKDAKQTMADLEAGLADVLEKAAQRVGATLAVA